MMMQGTTFISVILPLKLEWEPCYSLPSSVEQNSISIGERVRVRFAFKEYIGVVSAIGITPDIDPKRIQPIICIETGLEHILPEEISLWRKVSEYYMCSIGEVYKAAYPSMKVNLEEARAAAKAKIRLRREKLLNSMLDRIGKLEARLASKEERLSKSKEGTKAWQTQKEGAEKLRNDLLRARSAYAAASSNNEATSQERQESCISHINTVSLTAQQTISFEAVKKGFEEGKPVLLHGVTGSGKTEIYIKLAQETLQQGRNVLYLVPEIALSRQLEERLLLHFGDSLLTYHSGESAVSRRAVAEAVRTIGKDAESRNYIVLGTRSSLFLPHHDLGLIIIDEEHDSSYKQDSPAPRYNGRDTALMLSRIHCSHIIMGSATPSLEELYNCECGRHNLVRLAEKYHGAENADVEIIDTTAERRKRGMHGSFSRKLIDMINSTLAKGEQVMILRSRRSWAPAMQCEECGDIPKCPHCNISLSFHKTVKGDVMLCHYCGYREEYSGKCSKCDGHLKALGAGTQRIEEEASALFPDARIARLDSDTGHNKQQETRIIKDFGKGEIDILIGTQMVAKGFDFSNLTLVAVIAADTLTGIQDFRADEKALQILEQFRGRCGRRDNKGLLAIQTSQPAHPVYMKLISEATVPEVHDLLEERKEFHFPPYSRIIEISVRDQHEERAGTMSGKLAEALSASMKDTSREIITGPYQPVIDKIANMHIRCIRISLPKNRMLKENKDAIRHAINVFEKERKYDGHIVVNVDPS